ncbi:MAG: histidine kinase [Gemmatimonadota bacterium]|nr:histidine kinase [Gemmatimonadota bacterium]
MTVAALLALDWTAQQASTVPWAQAELPGIYAYVSLASVTSLVPAVTLAERRDAVRRHRDIIDLSPVGYVAASRDGVILAVNGALATMLGYDAPSDLISRNIVAACYVDPSDHERLFAQADMLGATMTGEAKWKRRDGSHVDVLIRGRLVQDAMGNAVRSEAFVDDVTAERRAARAEAEHRVRMARLSRALQRLEETERGRIARDLHDRMGQSLSAVKLALNAAAKTAPSAPLAEASDMVDFAIGEARRLSFELRPTVLDDLGLAAAVTAYVRGRAAAAGFGAEVAITYDPEGVKPGVEDACYRIIQEAVHNVVLHADACRVSVRLERSANAVSIVVTDDGRGFDERTLHERGVSMSALGILGMTERAALLGGTLAVRSAPQRGTTVTARIPLEPA